MNQTGQSRTQPADVHSMGQLQSQRKVKCQPPSCSSPDGMNSVIRSEAKAWRRAAGKTRMVKQVDKTRKYRLDAEDVGEQTLQKQTKKRFHVEILHFKDLKPEKRNIWASVRRQQQQWTKKAECSVNDRWKPEHSCIRKTSLLKFAFV